MKSSPEPGEILANSASRVRDDVMKEEGERLHSGVERVLGDSPQRESSHRSSHVGTGLQVTQQFGRGVVQGANMTTPQRLRMLDCNISEDDSEIVTTYEVLDDQGHPVYDEDGNPMLATHTIRASDPKILVRTADRINGR